MALAPTGCSLLLRWVPAVAHLRRGKAVPVADSAAPVYQSWVRRAGKDRWDQAERQQSRVVCQSQHSAGKAALCQPTEDPVWLGSRVGLGSFRLEYPVERVHLVALLGRVQLEVLLGRVHLVHPQGRVHLVVLLERVRLVVLLRRVRLVALLGRVHFEVLKERVHPEVLPVGVHPEVLPVRVHPVNLVVRDHPVARQETVRLVVQL